MDELLKHLRFICRLLDALGEEDPPRRKFQPIKGDEKSVRYTMVIRFAPTYRQFEEWDAVGVIRGKHTRLKLEQVIRDELEKTLVGYRVRVRIELPKN